jgi:nucleotide-binding universal stress UspA family protein
MYRHILIPTDGSELAERAVTHGLSLAKFVGAKVTVIIVEERPGAWLAPFGETGAAKAFTEFTEEIKEYYASALDRVANAAKQAGVPCDTTQAREVQPYEAIIATATDRGCDLIVMASHGRSGLSAVVLGSVTNKVLTYTKVPVLVVRGSSRS